MPELSIIMGASNDNYGGEVYREVETTPTSNFKDRASRSLYTLHYAFLDIDYEVIFVVWNEDPNLESLLKWEVLKHSRIRVVAVPPEIAKTVEGGMQFHETWAKNVGIRRARSEMILCTNPDILWLDPFPRETLQNNGVTIAHRWTVNKAILDVGYDITRMKKFADNPDTRRNPDWNSNGDFTMMPKELWYRLNGFSTPPQRDMAGVDMQTVKRAMDMTGRIYKYSNNIYHVEHPGRKLSSSFNDIRLREDWGFPDVNLEEYTNGKNVRSI